MPPEAVRGASVPPFVTMLAVLVLLVVGGFVTMALMSANVGDDCALVAVDRPAEFWGARTSGFPPLTPDVKAKIFASGTTATTPVAYGHLTLPSALSEELIAVKGIKRSDCPRIEWDTACAQELRFYKPVRGGCYTFEGGGKWDLRFSPNLKDLYFSWIGTTGAP